MGPLKVALHVTYADPMRMLRANLRATGYEVITEVCGKDILENIHDEYSDLIVVGEALADLDCIEFIKLCKAKSKIPIIVMGRDDDSIGAAMVIKLGAEDFLSYPYKMEEFLARVGAVFRRVHNDEPDENDGRMTIGALTIDTLQRCAIIEDKEIPLTPIEYGILVYLAERAGQVIGHDELLAQIWGPEYVSYVHYLRVGVGRLRKKIEKTPSSPEYLITNSGVGYMVRSADKAEQ